MSSFRTMQRNKLVCCAALREMLVNVAQCVQLRKKALVTLFVHENVDAPQKGRRSLPALLYADNCCVLMSRTGVGLQRLLTGFNNFMDDLGLKTNVAKSHIMVVGKSPTILKTCFINNEKLLYVPTFSYLGILFE